MRLAQLAVGNRYWWPRRVAENGTACWLANLAYRLQRQTVWYAQPGVFGLNGHSCPTRLELTDLHGADCRVVRAGRLSVRSESRVSPVKMARWPSAMRPLLIGTRGDLTYQQHCRQVVMAAHDQAKARVPLDMEPSGSVS